ncbi:MAG TPA: tetratricopeptide repeat protein [Bacteroidia bacterium]|nr:tetratricopeptide repeat protein [Bacteroidia bacterium]
MAETKPEKNIDISETLSKTEQYIEDNRRMLSLVLGAVIVIIAGYLIYEKMYVGGKEKDARAQMFMAESYFRTDSLRLSINGDGNYPGFMELADNYGVSPSGNLAKLYLGMSYLRTGKYEEAIDALESYDGNDEVTTVLALVGIGDAYMELNKTDDAISYYEKASEKNVNNFTTPYALFKLGGACETAGKYSDAVEAYEQLKKDYPASTEGREVEKYIARAKAKVK